MPLSVPLVLDPGYTPGRFYSVHVHRVTWGADTVSVPFTDDHLQVLAANAGKGLRMVSACIAAELTDADVQVIAHSTGADAVARVLCDSETCASVAERYQRDGSEDVEAELARVWAAGQLPGQDVQLFRHPAELAQAVSVAATADMLTALLAVQQQRQGRSPNTIVVMADEMAEFAARVRHNSLLPDQSPDQVRAEIRRLMATARMPERESLRIADSTTVQNGGAGA